MKVEPQGKNGGMTFGLELGMTSCWDLGENSLGGRSGIKKGTKIASGCRDGEGMVSSKEMIPSLSLEPLLPFYLPLMLG